MSYYKDSQNNVFWFDSDAEKQKYNPGLIAITDAEADELRQPPPPPPEQITAELTAKIQQRLDDFARERKYDSIMSAATYATSTVAKFAAEGQYAVEARDATWAKAYELLAEYQQDGTIPTWADIEAQLPVLAWPSGA